MTPLEEGKKVSRLELAKWQEEQDQQRDLASAADTLDDEISNRIDDPDNEGKYGPLPAAIRQAFPRVSPPTGEEVRQILAKPHAEALASAPRQPMPGTWQMGDAMPKIALPPASDTWRGVQQLGDAISEHGRKLFPGYPGRIDGTVTNRKGPLVWGESNLYWQHVQFNGQLLNGLRSSGLITDAEAQHQINATLLHEVIHQAQNAVMAEMYKKDTLRESPWSMAAPTGEQVQHFGKWLSVLSGTIFHITNHDHPDLLRYSRSSYLGGRSKLGGKTLPEANQLAELMRQFVEMSLTGSISEEGPLSKRFKNSKFPTDGFDSFIAKDLAPNFTADLAPLHRVLRYLSRIVAKLKEWLGKSPPPEMADIVAAMEKQVRTWQKQPNARALPVADKYGQYMLPLASAPRRARQSMEFQPPFRTSFGDILTYHWMSKGLDGTDMRVSDWDKSRTNAQTGRDIVHHFKVRRSDGSIHTVSLESALGQLSDEQRSRLNKTIRSIQKQMALPAEEQLGLDTEAARTPVDNSRDLTIYRKLTEASTIKPLRPDQSQMLERAERNLGQTFLGFAAEPSTANLSLEPEVTRTHDLTRTPTTEQLRLFASKRTPEASQGATDNTTPRITEPPFATPDSKALENQRIHAIDALLHGTRRPIQNTSPADQAGSSRTQLAAAIEHLRGTARAGISSATDEPSQKREDRRRDKTALINWARDAGLLIDKLPARFKLDGTKDVGGTEHHVFEGDRWLKITKGSGESLGRMPQLHRNAWELGTQNATAESYLEKLELQNQVLHDDTVLHAVWADRMGNVALITSQPNYLGAYADPDKHIKPAFKAAGFIQLDTPSAFYRPSDNLVVVDIHDQNAVVQGNGTYLRVFDGAITHPVGALRKVFERLAAEQTFKNQSLSAANRILAAAARTNTNPSKAQIEAENYETGKVSVQGIPLSFENPAGSTRKGIDANGKAWEVTMPHHYGRILGTTGADKDHVDFFLGPDPTSPMAFVINQKKPGNGHFDEHKVMLGFTNPGTAARGYLDSYSQGWRGYHSIVPMTIPQLKHWLDNGNMAEAVTKAPVVSNDTTPLASSARQPLPARPDMHDYQTWSKDKATGDSEWKRYRADNAKWEAMVSDFASKQGNLGTFLAPLQNYPSGQAYREARVITRVPGDATRWRATIFGQQPTTAQSSPVGEWANNAWVPVAHNEFETKAEAYQDSARSMPEGYTFSTQPLFTAARGDFALDKPESAERIKAAYQYWDQLRGTRDSVFLLGPTPTSSDINIIAKAYSTEKSPITVKHKGKVKGVDSAETWEIHTPTGIAYLERIGRQLYLNSSDVSGPDMTSGVKGAGGTQAYQIAMTFAHNQVDAKGQPAPMEFIPDPRDVSVLARIRRISQMFSSALRHRTTNHLFPQLILRQSNDPNAAKLRGKFEIPGWKEGDTEGNIGRLALMEMKLVSEHYPEINQWQIDPKRGIFLHGNGTRVTENFVEQIISELDPGNTGTGKTTLLRAVHTRRAVSDNTTSGSVGLRTPLEELHSAGTSTALSDEISVDERILYASPRQVSDQISSASFNHLDRKLHSALARMIERVTATDSVTATTQAIAAWYGKDAPTSNVVRSMKEFAQRELIPETVLPREIMSALHQMQIKQSMGQQQALDVGRALSGNPKFSDLTLGSDNPAQRHPNRGACRAILKDIPGAGSMVHCST